MADWYVSQTKWAAITQWSALAPVTVGTIRRQLTGAAQYDYCAFIVDSVTTGITGASEPAWPQANNGTVVDGGVTWKNITGQAAYGWTGCAGDIGTLTSGNVINARLSGATTQDNIYLDSTQSETGLGQNTLLGYAVVYGVATNNVWSVSTAGSVPPVEADYTPGATLAFSGAAATQQSCNYFGVNFTLNGNLYPGNSSNEDSGTFQDGVYDFTAAGGFVFLNYNGEGNTVFRNPTFKMQSGAAKIFASYENFGSLELYDAHSLLGGSGLPTYIFSANGNLNVYCRGVDFSQVTGTNYMISGGLSQTPATLTFEECIVPFANLADTDFSGSNGRTRSNLIQCINCDEATNATNYNSYKVSTIGLLTTNTTVYQTGGAAIEGTPISWKMRTQIP